MAMSVRSPGVVQRNWGHAQAQDLALGTSVTPLPTAQTGAPKGVPSLLGWGRGFGTTFGSGTTDGLQYAYTPTTDWSLSAWFLRNGSGGGSLGRIVDYAGQLVIYFDSANLRVIRYTTGTAGEWICTVTPAASATRYYHLGIVQRGTAAPVWTLDGQVTGSTQSVGPSGTPLVVSGTACIGNRVSDSARGWDGVLLDLRLYRRALADPEIWALYDPRSRESLSTPVRRRVYVDLGAAPPSYTPLFFHRR